MTFAEKLKQLRKQNNLTQENLASEILVSRTLITKYESGVVYPTDENLRRLADYFGVTVSELMSDDERISITLETANSIKNLKFCLSVSALVISLTFVLLLALPIFSYGSDNFVYGTTSLLNAYIRYKNPLAVISFIISLLSSVYSVFLLFAGNFKHEKILKTVWAIIFGAMLCLFVITLVYGLRIIGSDSFRLNR